MQLGERAFIEEHQFQGKWIREGTAGDHRKNIDVWVLATFSGCFLIYLIYVTFICLSVLIGAFEIESGQFFVTRKKHVKMHAIVICTLH